MSWLTTVVTIVSLSIACIFGALWYGETHREHPVLPPTFVEARIKQASLVPVTEQISKVYAVCPQGGTFLGLGGAAKYVMAWSAIINYTVDLQKVKIDEKVIGEKKIWVIHSPSVTLLNDGSSLISENDFYKFNNEALIAKSPKALEEHYSKEKKRAHAIAKYISSWRIENDKSLKQDIKDQIKLIFFGQINQIAKNKTSFDEIEVEVAPSVFDSAPPNLPELCQEQPFSTSLALRKGADGL